MSDFAPSPTDDALAVAPRDRAAAPAPSRSPFASSRSPADGREATSSSRRSRCSADRPTRCPRPRLRLRLDGLDGAGVDPEVDLGTIIRTPTGARRPAGGSSPRRDRRLGLAAGAAGDEPRGEPGSSTSRSEPDAILQLDDWTVAAADLLDRQRSATPTAGDRSRCSAAPRVPVEVEIVDRATGERVPAGSASSAADGRYLATGRPPRRGQPRVLRGHGRRPDPRVERVCLRPWPVRDRPAGRARRGRGRRRLRPVAEPYAGSRSTSSTRRLELPLDRAIDLHAGRWVTADSTSTSSRPRPPCSRRRPRTSTSSTSWRPSGATCSRT